MLGYVILAEDTKYVKIRPYLQQIGSLMERQIPKEIIKTPCEMCYNRG